jgi:hypothetical protein
MLAVIAAGLLPACGSSGHSGTGGVGGSGLGTGGHGGTTVTGVCPLEAEPNNTRDTATPYVLGTPVTACIDKPVLDNDDIDMYAFTVPANNPAGGFVRLTFTEVGITGALDVKLYSAADNSEVAEIYTIDSGASIDGYLAVDAGKTYRIAVGEFASVMLPFRYTMNAVYTGVVDLYEPNDTKDAAKPIAVATPITAYQTAGYVEDPYAPEAFADWYSVVLKAGATVVKMSTVPTDIMGDIHLFDPEGAEVHEEYSTTPGANVTLMKEVATAGTYTISVTPFGGAPKAADEIAGGVPPDHFTRAYTLTVTQP